MKKLAAILCLSALTSGAFAQGLVAFANQPGTQISQGSGANVAAIPAGAAGTYYFGLLISATGTAGSWSFSGFYGTNSASAGRIAAHTGAVTGWQPGASMFYQVAGWSASLGTTFNPVWLVTPPTGAGGFFGVSPAAQGTAGGGSPVPAPAWNLFGGTGLAGFNLTPTGAPVPEPTSMALAGLGAAALLIFRRRK
jgi:hypothetical protein